MLGTAAKTAGTPGTMEAAATGSRTSGTDAKTSATAAKIAAIGAKTSGIDGKIGETAVGDEAWGRASAPAPAHANRRQRGTAPLPDRQPSVREAGARTPARTSPMVPVAARRMTGARYTRTTS